MTQGCSWRSRQGPAGPAVSADQDRTGAGAVRICFAARFADHSPFTSAQQGGTDAFAWLTTDEVEEWIRRSLVTPPDAAPYEASDQDLPGHHGIRLSCGAPNWYLLSTLFQFGNYRHHHGGQKDI